MYWARTSEYLHKLGLKLQYYSTRDCSEPVFTTHLAKNRKKQEVQSVQKEEK